MSVGSIPPSIAGLSGRIEVRLGELFRAERARWAEVDPDLEIPLASLEGSVLAGGKRLRPAFCFWAFVGCGGDPHDRLVIDAGAALEMLHTAALVHDDLIDASDRRHGSPTVHRDYEARHRRLGWHGDSDRFGAGVAVVLGDLALVYSDRLMAGAPEAAAAIFDEMRLEVNIGQYLDVLGAADRAAIASAAGPARARRIIRYKTAKYTVERPLHLGAALADPDRGGELAGRLSEFGLPLGEAFQLRDDLLGVFGDPDVTGKPVGDDLREGKPTLLASLAAAAADGEGTRLFATRFGAADLDATEVVLFQKLIESTGARAEVEREIDELVAAARAALAALPLQGDALDALGELAAFVAGRDR
jgi:geranylgeranyl diphosphate synthase, type I